MRAAWNEERRVEGRPWGVFILVGKIGEREHEEAWKEVFWKDGRELSGYAVGKLKGGRELPGAGRNQLLRRA